MSASPSLAVLIKGTWDPRQTIAKSLRPLNAAWGCVFAALGLSLIGIHAIDVAERLDPEAGQIAGTALRQSVFLVVGVIAAAMVAIPHNRFIGLLAWPAYFVVLGLLVFLLIPFVPESIVAPRNGSRRWINLVVADFQPAEVMKIAYVLAIAQYLRFRRAHRRFKGLIVPGLITLPPIALITVQPDLGTAMLFVGSLFAMLVAAGARLRHMAIIVTCAALAAPATWPVLKPHQKVRVVGLIQQVRGDRSSADDINYQSFTAQTLVGSGGVTGTDDRHARALVTFNRLPEGHNDMVFAVIATRFGMVGGLMVIGLFLVWLISALVTAAQCMEPFGRLLVVGLAAFIAVQMIVNIGMTIGLLPITGVTLPFVSYGGSSMLATWIVTGLIFNVGLHRPRPPFRSSFEYADDHA